MENTELIVAFSGLLLLILTFITIAYWEEARNFYSESFDRNRTPEERLDCVERFEEAFIVFRRLCILILICLIATVLPIFLPFKISNFISLVLLGGCSTILAIFLISMACGKFSVYYHPPTELEENIKKEQQEALSQKRDKKLNGISRFLRRFFSKSK